MAGFLKQYFDGRRTYRPAQILPLDGWCTVPGLGRLSLVWPWTSSDTPSGLTDEHGRDLDSRPCLELRAHRSDRDAVLVTWAERGSGLVVGSEWAAATARLHAAALRQHLPIALGGAMGHIARLDTGAEAVWRIVIPRHDETVHIEIHTPSAHADGYWPQIDTMLSTWTWDD